MPIKNSFTEIVVVHPEGVFLNNIFGINKKIKPMEDKIIFLNDNII